MKPGSQQRCPGSGDYALSPSRSHPAAAAAELGVPSPHAIAREIWARRGEVAQGSPGPAPTAHTLSSRSPLACSLSGTPAPRSGAPGAVTPGTVIPGGRASHVPPLLNAELQ